MIPILPQDDELAGMRGQVLRPSGQAYPAYQLDRCVGVGGMSVVYFAKRITPDGETPSVVKLMRPWFVRQSGTNADKAFKKEAVALGRLAEQVPTTPFVVRMFDVGAVDVRHGSSNLVIPWIALEFVFGGKEGTTLARRVASSIETTGAAFDPARVARAVECLAEGLTAIHDVDVIHRDLKPDNILACGFGAQEIFKIADFGIARPSGVAETFGGLLVGTPGYAAPEQAAAREEASGPFTDVFALAAVTFHMMTGEDYFAVEHASDAIRVVREKARRSVLSAKYLCPEFSEREAACRAIDGVLARATSMRSVERPPSARALADMLLPHVKVDSRKLRPSALRVSSLVEEEDYTRFASREWIVRSRPRHGFAVRSIAWNADGTCLAATSEGLVAWDGLSWRHVAVSGLPVGDALRFVRTVVPGEYLIGGLAGLFATFRLDRSLEGVRSQEGLTIEQASGRFDDLAVVLATAVGEPPTLHALAARRWLKPLPLTGVALVSGLARLQDSRWLLSGRTTQGTGYAAVYDPLDWSVKPFPNLSGRAYLTCATNLDKEIGIVSGVEGECLWVEGGQIYPELIEEGVAVTATNLDAAGRGWAAGGGRVWCRTSRGWICIWSDPAWKSPIVSVRSEVGVVLAVSADGGVIEGRVRL